MTHKFKFLIIFAVVVFGGLFFNHHPVEAANDATYISSVVPMTMTVGQSYSVSVTMQNTGTTTWTCCSPASPPGDVNSVDGIKLASHGGGDPWGILRIKVPNSVAPGAQVTFNFNVTAPSTAGSYFFGFRMIEEFVQNFGDSTGTPAVNVVYEAPTCGAPPNAALPDGDWTTAVSGTRLTTVAGVANATSVGFGAWSDANGQDDIIWYPGTNLSGGNWSASINLANHTALGAISVYVYLGNASYPFEYCDSASFVRLGSGTINVTAQGSDGGTVQTNWTLKCILDNPLCPTYSATNQISVSYSSLPFSTWTVVPATIAGYTATVTPCASQISQTSGGLCLPTPAVTWTNAQNVTVSGNNLTATTSSGWAAGATSTQTIASGDGYVEFSTSENNLHKMGGLSNGNSNTDFTDIDYGLYPTASGIVQVYEKGVQKGGDFTAYSANNVFRVAVVSGVVKYYVNGALIYTSAAAPTYPLLFDSSINSTGGTITKAVIYP